MVDTNDILLAIKCFADHHANAEGVPQQNPQQSRCESGAQSETEKSQSLAISGTDYPCPMAGVGDEGLSESAQTLGNTQVLQQRGVKTGAVKVRTTMPAFALDLAKQLSAEQRQRLVQLLD